MGVLPVHGGNDGRRRPTGWRRKTRRRDSNGQPCEGEREERINTLKQTGCLNSTVMMVKNLLGGGMSGGAALTLGGGGRKGGGGMFGGIGPGGKKVGNFAGVGSASDCSAITCSDQQTAWRHGRRLSFEIKQSLTRGERLCCFCVPEYCCRLDCVCVGLRPG